MIHMKRNKTKPASNRAGLTKEYAPNARACCPINATALPVVLAVILGVAPDVHPLPHSESHASQGEKHQNPSRPENEIDWAAVLVDLMKMSKDADHVSVVIWYPRQFFQANLALKKMPPEIIEKVDKALGAYLFMVVARGKTGPFGGVTYQSEKEIREMIQILEADGAYYRPLSEEQIDPDVKNFVAMMTLMVTNAAGPFGVNPHIVVFPGKNKHGEEIANATKEGSFWVKLGEKQFKWRLPLGSFLPRKVCQVDGEELSGAWTYCPWHGTKLAEARSVQLRQEPLRAGENITPPRKIKNVTPVYPDSAKKSGIQGIVILEAIIDAQGDVTHARVIRSIPALDQAAIDAVKQWKYEPTLLEGVPVPIVMTVTVNFSLQYP